MGGDERVVFWLEVGLATATIPSDVIRCLTRKQSFNGASVALLEMLRGLGRCYAASGEFLTDRVGLYRERTCGVRRTRAIRLDLRIRPIRRFRHTLRFRRFLLSPHIPKLRRALFSRQVATQPMLRAPRR